MAGAPLAVRTILERLQQRDLPGARAAVEAALAHDPDASALLELGGVIAGEMGDHARAADRFGRLLQVMPTNSKARLNQIRALMMAGSLDAAAQACAAAPEDPDIVRLAAYIHQQQGRLDAAIAAYRFVVAAFPDDHQSWNNLGNALVEQGDLAGASTALGQAAKLRPDLVPILINLANVLTRADLPEACRDAMREAVAHHPRDPSLHLELGLAETGVRDFPAAERAFRAAIALSEGFSPAYLELGLLFENLNRIDDLEALIAQADADGVDRIEIDFLRAWNLRRRGRLDAALPLAQRTPETINPIRRAQLLAELYDRLGYPEEAFAAFTVMNREAVRAKPAPPGPSYREVVAADAALITPDHIAQWTSISVPHQPPAPVFIVGFPRSGTTLLDTLLMNMPGLHVLEELPVLRRVKSAAGAPKHLARLTTVEAAALRALYFRKLGELSPPPAGATIVDKFPLQMAQMPLIHRVFPDAKIVLVERHPCDAVLSCFMSNFQLNAGMRSFTDLEEAALTYDAVFDSWTRATTLLPIRVHRVRYERMVADLEREMRGLLDFLELPWDPGVLDNQASAGRREHIRTASYSQVTEPIYTRAAGRWERYRAQLAPVLPILAPWAEALGYAIAES